MFKRFKKLIISLIVLSVLILIFIGLHIFNFKSPTPTIYGTTFSYEYAEYLGLDPHAAFIKILDDYKFRYIRIPVPWNMIEPDNDGHYEFTELDWFMNEAEKRHAHIILAVGQKTPRWPECHTPLWAQNLSLSEQHTLLTRSVTATVSRYKDSPALEAWQVENEPYLQFGNCPKLDEKFFKELLQYVKDFDPQHPIMVTDTGELSLWIKSGQVGDWFGTTLYRTTWNEHLGFVHLDFIPASWYRLRLLWSKHEVKNSFVIELQGEPWINKGTITEATTAENDRSLSLDRFKENIVYAEHTGLPRVYTWGVEWWIWVEEHGNNSFSDVVKKLPKE